MAAILTLGATVPLGRDQLEEAAFAVEEALDKHALDVTGGVSASANFVTNSIDVDLVLDGVSVAEVHEKLAQLITILEEHCGMRFVPESAQAAQPALVIQSTATHAVTGSLIPA